MDTAVTLDGGSDTLTGGSFSNRWGISYGSGGYVLKSANSDLSAMHCTAVYPGADILTSMYSASGYGFYWTVQRIPVYPHGILLYNTKTQSVVDYPTICIRPGVTSTLSSINLAVAVYSGYPIDQSVTWTSSNTDVATVNSASGTVTSVAYGSVYITASKTIAGKTYSQSYRLVVSEIPVSGWELEYEPDLWNYSPVQYGTNCYSYALDNQVHPDSNTLWYMHPGAAAGYTLTRDNLNADTIVAYVKADATALGFTFTEIKRDEYCPTGSYKVALVIAQGEDYHWYRQNLDGTWSHKPGQTAVTDKDANQSTILNPETADRDYSYADYSEFVGFFRVTPLSNMYRAAQSTLSSAVTESIRIETFKAVLPSSTEAAMISPGMTYTEVTEAIGLPQRHLAHGLIVVEYALSDGAALVIEYVVKNGQYVVYSCTIEGE